MAQVKNQPKKPLASYVMSDEEENGSGQNAFMNLYASLMILLMTFFIVIYSYSTHSQAKFEMARQSLYKVFETLGIQETREIISFLKSKLPSSPETEDQHKQLLLSLAEISKQLEQKFGGAEVELRRYQTKIMIPKGKLFEDDGAVLNEEALQIIENIVKYIKKDKYSQIVISSHYSSVRKDKQTPESRQKDWMLSTLRAVVISQNLADSGLDVERISAMGHGGTNPVVDFKRTPGASNNKNTRIEIVVKKPQLPPEEEYELFIKSQ